MLLTVLEVAETALTVAELEAALAALLVAALLTWLVATVLVAALVAWLVDVLA
ncbi:hypothetical protein LPA07_09310 [Lactiplantibacillus paraplantarum]|nr:hypothetical protein LPA07_09310 [Lactiplantibacillus paraplantarum]